MRLIRLKIRNVASLKGEHEIDFADIQRGSPLFAITGETGAGKSSVLNSIGLALYGEIYKKNINQIDVVTLGEKEGLIELIFQVKGNYYLADWRARALKQNGEPYSTPQSPVRNLYKIDGPDFSDHKTIASVTCAELLNLDFDQFCRCIILNQGEFAKFLNSSFKDRRDILEKLYPGEMLDNLSRELESEKKALEKSKHEAEIELHTLRGDNVSGELLKEQKNKFEKELTELEIISKHVEKLNYHFVSLSSYHKNHLENERRKTQVKEEIALETTKYNHLLKSGESIFNAFQEIKKKEESDLPLLQTYLKREETLKLLEESWKTLKKRKEEILSSLKTTQDKLNVCIVNEKTTSEKLQNIQKSMAIPLEDLKSSRPHFEPLFDIFNEKEFIEQELRGKNEQLSSLEVTGKELKQHFEEIENKIKLLPPNAKEMEEKILQEKNSLSARIDEKQRAEIKFQELSKQIEVSKKTITELSQKVSELESLIKKTQETLFPIETTLKLQEVLNASEICVDHAITNDSSNCPVCEQVVPNPRWLELKNKLSRTDLKSLRLSFDEGNKVLFKSQKETELIANNIENEKKILSAKEQELNRVIPLKDALLPDIKELDAKISLIQKQAWELEALKKDLTIKNNELLKTREQYARLKNELSEKEKTLTLKEEKLKTIAKEVVKVIPLINRETIQNLKSEVKTFNQYLEVETTLGKILQEKLHLEEQKANSTKESTGLQGEEETQLKKIQEIQSELKTALKGEKASDLIQKLNTLVKNATEAWNKQTEEQSKQEQTLKRSQGRLYEIEEQTKHIDIHFTQELHTVRELAKSDIKYERLECFSKLKNLDLTLSSPHELFIPIEDLLNSEKEHYKEVTNQCRMNFASISTRLSDWEKLQDKILLLELKAKDINDALARKMRLFEVLGKDELRTFVLSLVEENLIHQTNDELQKLCQGRYEIVHQTRSLKMTPEFFILDKFREGGRRKVSTLSGGETFMVSLAMALGLAEMTRGQAEIDSLFIDEGFGTLDQDSLEDVLDMLKQIQTRGLMVGIISHIKTLTNALPVNLVLSKKQDGTSNISVQYN